MYSLCRICVLSLIILLALRTSSYKAVRGLFEAGYFATNAYNMLQLILVFLTDVPKQTHQRKCQNTGYKIYKTDKMVPSMLKERSFLRQ